MAVLKRKGRHRGREDERSWFQSHRNPGGVLMGWALAGCGSRRRSRVGRQRTVQGQPPGG